jgi:hypothetical protein
MRFLGFSNHENGAPRLLLKLAANGGYEKRVKKNLAKFEQWK